MNVLVFVLPAVRIRSKAVWSLPASSETYRLLWSGFRSDCIADVSEEFRHSCGSFAPDSPLEGSGFEP
jgi:hypothetical protein